MIKASLKISVYKIIMTDEGIMIIAVMIILLTVMIMTETQ